MDIITLPINQITPYERNPRVNDGAVDAVAESIKQCGYRARIIVDENNVVLCGHTRLKAIKKLGWEQVEVQRETDLTEEQKRKYRLLDNRVQEESTWDYDLLADELDGLDFGDLELDWGIGGEDEPPEVTEDDYDPEPPAEPKAKLGDIYQLGRHRLMCGDSTSAEDVARLMDGAKADLLLTDPPYNVDVGKNERPFSSHNGERIQNDCMQDEEFIEFLTEALKNATNNMNSGRSFYIWYSAVKHICFEQSVKNVGELKLHEQLVWVKSHFILGRNSDYQWQHELCLYGWKTGAEHYFTDSRSESTVIEDKKAKLSTLKKDELIALCEKMMGVTKSTTILRAEKPNSADLHPTVKPQALLAPLILNSTRPGENVLDLFGGSGSTLIACEQTGRTCYMMELDPRYVDVIIDRWEQFTGEKAVKIKG